jgi:hypothetical protein
MAFIDTIRLAFGHSLIAGNIPDKILLNKVAEKQQSQETGVESFGLFDSNSSNFNTFYPGVTEEDLKPKDADYVEPVFRALSEVVVHKGWNPIDFGQNGVLKKSMPLLQGQTVYPDHEAAVGNSLGVVKEVAWQNSYKTPAGIVIPSGINAKLSIDGKSNPKIARAVMSDPPSVHSTSATVQFLWDKSHPTMKDDEFWKKLGSFDQDGQMLRRIVTLVKNYHELSLVSHGADPFAQKIKDDKGINNPKWADMAYNAFHPERPATKYFMFDFKTDLIQNAETETIPAESNSKDSSQTIHMNKAFLISLAMIFGLKFKGTDGKEVDYTEETITEDGLNAQLTAVQTERAALQKRPDVAPDELTRLQGVEAEYNKIKDRTTLAEQVDKLTTDMRVVVIKNLNILKNNKIPETQLSVINKADYATLQVLNEQYITEIDEKFPLSCKKCNSTDINRASVRLGDDKDKSKSSDSNLSIKDQLSRKAAQKSFAHMHGQVEEENTEK